MRQLLSVLLLLCLPDVSRAGDTPPEVSAQLDRLRSSTDALRQYTYTFRRQEWLDGKQQDPQVMAVKFRKPFDVYMTWTGEVYTGRELIYRQGWNNGRLHVKPAPGALIPTVNLDPTGKLAMRGSRHGIEMIDIGNVVELILSQTERLQANDALSATFTVQGSETINGEPSHCLRIDLPKDLDPGLYAQRVDLCTSTTSGLLTRLRAWDNEDGAVRKVEDYEFRGLDASPGLTDLDFDPDNPAYGF